MCYHTLCMSYGEIPDPSRLDRLLSETHRAINSGEFYTNGYVDYEDLNPFFERLRAQVKGIKGDFYLGYMESDYQVREYDPVALPTSVTAEMIVQDIATAYAGMRDYPNDFHSAAIFELEAKSNLIILLKSEELGIVCDVCDHDQDVYLEPGESCEHEESDYDLRCGVAVCSNEDLNNFEWNRLSTAL